jgi:SpoVK/Ycf46/Vps4 family AAA+-type ATPase
MALIRQLVTEYIIFPLGSELCRTRHRTNISSFLFYGPQGTGKTLVIRAIVHETNSILFDLSPINIDGKFTEKKGEEKMVAAVMVTAKEYQPSVIYIDECEKVWPAKKKGGKKKGAKGKKKADPSNPSRIKKVLAKWKAKFVDSDNSIRITIIGCTNLPQEGTMKDFKKFFTAGKNKMNAIWFSVPDYSTLRMMWRRFIEKHGGKLKSDFPLSTLA